MKYLKNSNGEESLTATLLVATFVVTLLKLLLAGVEYKGLSFGKFSGSDFAAAIGAVGALYWGRRHTEKR
jgi:hypothetical protein